MANVEYDKELVVFWFSSPIKSCIEVAVGLQATKTGADDPKI